MIEFPHKPPEGYSYEQVPFKSNVVAIWIHNHYRFVYNGGGVTRSIWGLPKRSIERSGLFDS